MIPNKLNVIGYPEQGPQQIGINLCHRPPSRTQEMVSVLRAHRALGASFWYQNKGKDSGQFLLPGGHPGGKVVPPAIPTPLPAKKTNQSPIVLDPALNGRGSFWGHHLTRFRAARALRLRNFENGRDMGHGLIFKKKGRLIIEDLKI